MTLQLRPRNAATTRESILQAARTRFMHDGYDHAGLRAIAADAGVDPALICRYFGGKERLFADVLATTGKDPMEVIAGDRDTFGSRVANALLAPSDRSLERMAFIQLAIRSSTSPVASTLVRSHIEKQFIVPFSEWIGGERAMEKAWLIGSMLMGAAAMIGIGFAQPGGRGDANLVNRLAHLLQSAVDSP
jgi:AcrR family transcriptional regulator